MTTDYNAISRQYQLSKLQPWRAHIEAFSLLGLVGDLAGQTVLDVACGEGFYTRLLHGQGASATTGVDLSAGMIELARAQEAAEPQGIRYGLADAATMSFEKPFDVVVAAYCSTTAHDRTELAAMCWGAGPIVTAGGPIRHGQQQSTARLLPGSLLPKIRLRNRNGGRAGRRGADHMDLSLARRIILDRELFPSIGRPMRSIAGRPVFARFAGTAPSSIRPGWTATVRISGMIS